MRYLLSLLLITVKCYGGIFGNSQTTPNIFYDYITVYGNVYAYKYYGDASNLTNNQATNITGVLTSSQLPANVIYGGGTSYTFGGVTLTASGITSPNISSGTVNATTLNVGTLNVTNSSTTVVSSVQLVNLTQPIAGGLVPSITSAFQTNWCLMEIDSTPILVATNPADNNLLYRKFTITQSEVSP